MLVVTLPLLLLVTLLEQFLTVSTHHSWLIILLPICLVTLPYWCFLTLLLRSHHFKSLKLSSLHAWVFLDRVSDLESAWHEVADEEG